jgi:hypothetical protein
LMDDDVSSSWRHMEHTLSPASLMKVQVGHTFIWLAIAI